MKLKDIEPGEYYLMKGDSYTGRYPVEVSQIIEVPTGDYWVRKKRANPPTMKKVRVHRLWVQDTGAVILEAAGMDVVPGQVSERITKEHAEQLVINRHNKRNQNRSNTKLADQFGAQFMSCLIAAGFGNPTQDYKGVHISNAQVADWARRMQGAK